MKCSPVTLGICAVLTGIGLLFLDVLGLLSISEQPLAVVATFSLLAVGFVGLMWSPPDRWPTPSTAESERPRATRATSDSGAATG